MNTVSELIEKGLNRRNAENIVWAEERRIGEEHGDFEVKDIAYIGGKEKDVLLICRHCGTEIHKRMVTLCGTSWKRMQSVCECRKEAEKETTQKRKILARGMAQKEKQCAIESNVGQIYGEYKIVGIDGNNYVAQCTICDAVKMWGIQGMPQRTDFVCHTHRQTKERFTEAYIGMKNNYLTVIGITWDKKTGRKRFRCQCDCGNITEIKPTFWESGQVKSCGCYYERLKVEHTPEKDRIRAIFHGMRGRCYNENNEAYKYYGLRGISICSEWLSDPEKFVEWSLSHGYANDLSIDRIDNDGNYEPGNCRWADDSTQSRNRRSSCTAKIYKFNGEYVSVKDLCERLPLDRRTLRRGIAEGKHIQGAVFAAHRAWKEKHGKTNKRKEG